MLDLSIKNITKMSDIEFEDFRKDNWIIEEKYDGVKISLIRNEKPYNPDDYTDNWILAYKGNIIYPFEACFSSDDDIKNSIGCSQFALIHRHIKKINYKTKSIPKKTEFFLEFLMKKPTLTREYDKNHSMKLLAYSPIESYKIQNGQIETKPTGFFTFLRECYANIFKFNIPNKMGGLTPQSYLNKTEFLREIKQLLNNSYSSEGGIPEGLVFINSKNQYWKVLQHDQHDKSTRLAIKLKYKYEDKDLENEYWKKINEICSLIEDNIQNLTFESTLLEGSNQIYNKAWDHILPNHDKKNYPTKRDDLFLTFKIRLTKKISSNNFVGFIGKFRMFTKAHYNIIAKALTNYNGISIGIVTGSKQIIPKQFRQDVIRKCFPQKNVEIIHLQNGNLINLLKKSKNNINAIICGTDRIESYKKQLKGNLNVKLVEEYRTENDLSSTKVIRGIMFHGFIDYTKGVPKEIANSKFYKKYEYYLEKR